MYSPEAVHQRNAENPVPKHSPEEEMFLENMLQMGWFQERYKQLSSDEIQKRLNEIAAAGGDLMRRRIDDADEGGRQEIILEDMILSSTGEGGPERKWFREVFLPMSESKSIRILFEQDPELAAKAIESLYRKSLH